MTLAACDFLVIDSNSNGLFTEETSDGDCEKYDDDFDFNSAEQAGRAFGVLANLLIVLAFVGISLVIFLLKEKAARMVWMATRIVYVCALLSVLLTFVSFGSKRCTGANECKPGNAANAYSVNVFILLGIVLTVWCTPIPDEPMLKFGRPRKHNQDIPASSKSRAPNSASVDAAPQITKTIKMTPHGRKTKEVVVHSNGRKTVTETFEEGDDFPTEAGSCLVVKPWWLEWWC